MIFTARGSSEVCDVDVCLSVRLTQIGVALNVHVGSRKQRRTAA